MAFLYSDSAIWPKYSDLVDRVQLLDTQNFFSDSEKKTITRVCLTGSWPVTAAGGHATTERQLTCLCRLLIAHKLRKNWAPPDQALSVDPSASVDPDFHG